MRNWAMVGMVVVGVLGIILAGHVSGRQAEQHIASQKEAEKEPVRSASPADLEELRRDWRVQSSRQDDLERRQDGLGAEVYYLKAQQQARDKRAEALERQLRELQKGKS